MSFFSYESLPVWSAEGDKAGPISSTPEYDANVMATWCRLDQENEVAYGPDVPLVVRRGVPLPLGDMGFFAIVAEPKDVSISASLKDKELIMATWPLSRGWYARGTFQFGSKHPTKRLGKDLEEAYRQSPRVLRDLLQKLQKNPFDSRHDVVTAVLCDPYPLDPLRKFILGRQCYVNHFETKDGDGKGKKFQPMQLMAICDDFERLREVLIQDRLLLDMIDATCGDRNLLLRFHASRINQNAVSAKNMEKDPASYLIFEEIAGEGLAWEIMRAAIDLALGGPVSLESFRPNLDSQKQADGRKLAKHRARDIYLDLYWNLWKRTATLRRAETKKSVKRTLAPQKSKAKADSEKEFWLAADEVAAGLDLAPGQIKATAEQIIHAFVVDDSLAGLPCGPDLDHSKERQYSTKACTTDKTVLIFLLHAAALLERGYDSPLLAEVLTELRDEELPRIKEVIGWIEARHPLFRCKNGRPLTE